MLTYADIADRVAAGESAAEIAAALVASAVTVEPIDLSELRFYLRDAGLLLRGIDRPFEGALAELARSEQTPTDLRTGLVDLITHTYDDSKVTLSTDTPEIAARGKVMLAGLTQTGVMTAEQVTGFYSLGGGLKYATVTAADVQAAIDQHAAEQFRQSQEALLTSAYLAAQSALALGKSNADIAAAFSAAMGVA